MKNDVVYWFPPSLRDGFSFGACFPGVVVAALLDPRLISLTAPRCSSVSELFFTQALNRRAPTPEMSLAKAAKGAKVFNQSGVALRLRPHSINAGAAGSLMRALIVGWEH